MSFTFKLKPTTQFGYFHGLIMHAKSLLKTSIEAIFVVLKIWMVCLAIILVEKKSFKPFLFSERENCFNSYALTKERDHFLYI